MLIVRRVVATLAVVVAIPYLVAPVYRFPAERTFSGPALRNPYAHLSGVWQRANLHAHGYAWRGLTNGRQPDTEVVAAYKERGYSVAGISNYHYIAADHGVDTLPLYEHGYNLLKQHQLAVGAHRVDWFDFPLWESLSQKQYVIDRVARTADLVAVTHPWSGYTEDDFRALCGYELMEVVNGPYTNGEDLWDAALSSGHVVWAIANDDSHDVADVKRTAIAWNMIDAPTAGTADIVEALRAGRSYAVSLAGTTRDAELQSVELHHQTLTVTAMGVPATFLFVGQQGTIRKTVDQAMTASYTLTPQDQYIRTVIRTPNLVMYLNPIIRHGGNVAAMAAGPTVNTLATWATRGVIVVACFAVVTALWKRSPGSRRRDV